jgi:hypothetical protein
MDSDQELKQGVGRELEWDPKVVYTEKSAALRAAERLYGVTGVPDEIGMRPSGKNVQGDPAIAEAIKRAFDWRLAPSPPELAVLELCVRPVDERSAALDEVGRSPAGVIVVSAARHLAEAERRTLAALYLEQERSP